jgi:hypothetical protein
MFVRCVNSDCFILEGGTRAMFDHMTMEMNWPAGPVVPMNPGDPHLHETAFPVIPALVAYAGQSMRPTAR